MDDFGLWILCCILALAVGAPFLFSTFGDPDDEDYP